VTLTLENRELVEPLSRSSDLSLPKKPLSSLIAQESHKCMNDETGCIFQQVTKLPSTLAPPMIA